MRLWALPCDIYKWIDKRLLLYFMFWNWSILLNGTNAGCPKVCECKWKGGKQYVSCSNAKFIDIPQGLEPSTQVLNLEHNNLKILFRDAFVDRGLVNLQKVYLTYCNLRKLEKGSFRKLANLVELDVSNNFLTFIPNRALSDVTDLRQLKMRNNSLSFIPSGSFKDNYELVDLDLAYNKISRIEDGAFLYLTKLEVLNLSGNQLHTLTGHVLRPLDSLHGFYIHGNPWNCNCSLRSLLHWMTDKNIPAPIPPICFSPERLENRPWNKLELNEFVCIPNVFTVSSHVFASYGENVSLGCIVETDNEGLVTWLISDRVLAKGDYTAESRYKVFDMLSDNKGSLSRVSNLTILGAHLHDQGVYNCVVENKAGKDETNLTLIVSEVIKEDPLVEIDQVFVAGALLGGLTFVIFAIFIACVVFCKRKRKHTENISKMNEDIKESYNSAKISDSSETYKHENVSKYAEYQIIPTSDNDNARSDLTGNLKANEASLENLKNNAIFSKLGKEDGNLRQSDRKSGEKIFNLGLSESQHSEFGSSKTSSLGAEEPLLQDLAEQCKNEILKRHQHYKDSGNVFSVPKSIRYPDLLTSQNANPQHCRPAISRT